MTLSTITPGRIKTGPGIIRYAPLGTAIPTIVPSASSYSGLTWTSWVDPGATLEGLTYTESLESEQLYVAESKYPVKTEVTTRAGSIAFALAQIDDLNWKLAMNGGTITVSGTGATKQSLYIPPLSGNEVRVMLAFQSLADDEVIVWGQVLNTGSVETARGALQSPALQGLPMEFASELPADTAVFTTPYKRWTCGALSVSP